MNQAARMARRFHGSLACRLATAPRNASAFRESFAYGVKRRVEAKRGQARGNVLVVPHPERFLDLQTHLPRLHL
jgi:hypothetical protein